MLLPDEHGMGIGVPTTVTDSTIFYTRMGIGIFDQRWWDFRLRLFRAATLPSIGRHCLRGATWLIFIDDELADEHRSKIEVAVRENDLVDSVTVLPVRFFVDVPAALAEAIGGRPGNVSLVRVDDDDAIADDFLDYMPRGQGVFTLPVGLEWAVAERKLRPFDNAYLSLNTLYTGPVESVHQYAVMGHHRLATWAQERGVATAEIRTSRPMYLYARHKQSDSSFPSRRRLVLEDPEVEQLDAGIVERFALDSQLLEDWRQHASAAPAVPSAKTWDLSLHLNSEVQRVRRAGGSEAELARLKQRIRDVTSNVMA